MRQAVAMFPMSLSFMRNGNAVVSPGTARRSSRLVAGSLAYHAVLWRLVDANLAAW